MKAFFNFAFDPKEMSGFPQMNTNMFSQTAKFRSGCNVKRMFADYITDSNPIFN